MLGITYYQIFVKAHQLIKKVEKYHILMCYIYIIIQVETQDIISKNTMLHMVFKAINDIVGPDSLVLTLFIFGTYLCIIMDSTLSPLQ